jgi:hypothetical protein
VWNCIECTHISNPGKKATPDQVRAEVWMSLIHGSRGLIYFVHQFKPAFKEAAVLDDPELLAAISAINQQIHQLAPVLNSPSITNAAVVKSPDGEAQIAWMSKQRGNVTYLFAVNMRNRPARTSFSGRKFADHHVEVLGESRQVQASNGEFIDEFQPYAVHLYSVKSSN